MLTSVKNNSEKITSILVLLVSIYMLSNLLWQFSPKLLPSLGLDIKGGSFQLYSFDLEQSLSQQEFNSPEQRDKFISNILQKTSDSLRSRLDISGTKDIEIRSKGEDQIQVLIPSGVSSQDIENLITQQGKLEFREVLNFDSHIWDQHIIEFNKNYKGAQKYSFDWQNKFNETYKNELPTDSKLLIENSTYEHPIYHIVDNHSWLDGSNIIDSRVIFTEKQKAALFIKMDPEGTRAYTSLTSKRGRQFVITLDQQIQSFLQVDEQITTNESEIHFSADISIEESTKEASALNIILKAGSLPVSLEKVASSNIGPSLGKDSLQRGVYALIVALLGVLVFLLFYYKLNGFILFVSACLSLIISLFVLSVIGSTLSLPGLAGFILSIGLAVDGGIILLERKKENSESIMDAYKKSLWTLLDANITTAITAIVLGYFTSGAIRGFAVTLLIGIFSSLLVMFSLQKQLLYRLEK